MKGVKLHVAGEHKQEIILRERSGECFYNRVQYVPLDIKILIETCKDKG